MTHRHPALRRWLLPSTLSAIIAGSVVWYSEPAPTPTPPIAITPQASPVQPLRAQGPMPAVPASPSTDDRTGDTTVAHRTPVSLGASPFADSLTGTDIDGALRADAQGQLMVDLATRDFFDYFLNTVGEVEPEVALAQIRALAEDHLPATAATQAMALLEQYLGYKQQALALHNVALDPTRQHDPDYQLSVLGQAFSDLRQLRLAAFSPQAHDAFFGLEEAYGEYTLATLAVNQRQDLSSESKQALLEWHRNQLPDALKATEQHLITSTRDNLKRVEIIQNAESPARAGQQLVAAGMSPEAAEGVIQYLHDREGFDHRYGDYRAALDTLNASGLDASDRAVQQARLLQEHFPDPQQQTWARLKMLERDG